MNGLESPPRDTGKIGHFVSLFHRGRQRNKSKLKTPVRGEQSLLNIQVCTVLALAAATAVVVKELKQGGEIITRKSF